MANIKFTRDEVILTLDAIYFSGESVFTSRSDAVKELSALLQELPIHPLEKRTESFRNTFGISDQIRAFNQQIAGSDRIRWGVGKLFFEVAEQYQNNLPELHQIANAIRRNKKYLCDMGYGNFDVIDDAPEGQILPYLHHKIEMRDGRLLRDCDRCSICQISLKDIYADCDLQMEHHLVVPLSDLDVNLKYKSDDFIDVCPNCHAVLHRYRPWRTKENASEIIK